MIVKIHKDGDGRRIMAVCDDDIKGKIFSSGRLRLDLSSPFFDGKSMDEAETEKLMKSAYIINAAGKRSNYIDIKN